MISSNEYYATENVYQIKDRLGAINMFKRNSITMIAFTFILAVVICICFMETGVYARSLYSNYSLNSVKTVKGKNVNTIEVNVDGCNITFEKGTTDSFKFKYYGKASKSNYKLKTSVKDKVLKIELTYIGTVQTPITVEKGGIIITVPDKKNLSLNLTGTSAGIILKNIYYDINLITTGCAVELSNDKINNKVTIDSTEDAYNIYGLPTKDFSQKASGSAIDFELSEAPKNFNFQLSDEGSTVEIPKKWTYNYSIGTGKPDMLIDLAGCAFNLFYE